MTIRIINSPRLGESWCPVFKDVKQVTKDTIVFHDGTYLLKNLSAKVELISVMDIEYQELFKKYPEYERIGKGTLEDWKKLDLPTYI